MNLTLDPDTIPGLESFEVVPEIDSTNTVLLKRAPPVSGKAIVLLAERQSAGRGRHGRHWIAAPGEVLCLSVGWVFERMPQDMPALSLAVGVSCARALRQAGIEGIGLKWPNDLVAAHRKLGGILIETRTEPGGAVYAVIGIGLNLELSAATRAAIRALGTEPVDACELAAPCGLDTKVLVSTLIESVIAALRRFACDGFVGFSRDWDLLDSLRGAAVSVRQGDTNFTGISRGIDARGALLVEIAGKLAHFLSGEVSLRAAE